MAVICSCQNNPPAQTIADSSTAKNDSLSKPPKISIEETTVQHQFLMVMKDTAGTVKETGNKLGILYGKIGACIKKCHMKMTGAPMAWYHKDSSLNLVEAGVPCDIKCAMPNTGIYNKEIAAGKAAVVHFFGPFELLPKGYDALNAWLKEHKKTATTDIWEVYVTDPTTLKDPYLVETDIYVGIQ